MRFEQEIDKAALANFLFRNGMTGRDLMGFLFKKGATLVEQHEFPAQPTKMLLIVEMPDHSEASDFLAQALPQPAE